MKSIIITIIVIAAALAVYFLWPTKPPAELPSATVGNLDNTTPTTPSQAANEKPLDITFSFTGYGPGKEHKGTFSTISGTYSGNEEAGVTAKIVIDSKTVSTGIAALDKHLCSEDFFNCPTYPTIVFNLSKIAKQGNVLAAEGTLTFNGVEQPISFPVTRTGNVISADFKLDTTPFKFKYTAINKEVRIEFTAKEL